VDTLYRKYDRDKITKSYKYAALFYDLWSKLTESKTAEKVLEISGIKNNMNVLEAAVGTGVVFEKIVRLNPDGNNMGIDLSPDMLRKARNRMEKLPSGKYELKEGDVMNLEFADNTFDVLISNYTVDLLPENTFGRIAEGFYRVLKPQGTLVTSTFSFGEKRAGKFWFWIAKKFPGLLTGCRPVSFKLYLERAGFIIEQILQISQNTFPSEIIKAKK
jgi:ubiquinone/menaquinone biosynthesis C-methylase UbiE